MPTIDRSKWRAHAGRSLRVEERRSRRREELRCRRPTGGGHVETVDHDGRTIESAGELVATAYVDARGAGQHHRRVAAPLELGDHEAPDETGATSDRDPHDALPSDPLHPTGFGDRRLGCHVSQTGSGEAGLADDELREF